MPVVINIKVFIARLPEKFEIFLVADGFPFSKNSAQTPPTPHPLKNKYCAPNNFSYHLLIDLVIQQKPCNVKGNPLVFKNGGNI